VVLVRSGVLSVDTTSLRLCHVMEGAVSGEVCAVTVVTGVHFDLEARRAVALGREVREGARERTTGFDPGT